MTVSIDIATGTIPLDCFLQCIYTITRHRKYPWHEALFGTQCGLYSHVDADGTPGASTEHIPWPELAPQLGVASEETRFGTSRELMSEVESELARANPVIVAVRHMKLPYTPAFNVIDTEHFLLFQGVERGGYRVVDPTYRRQVVFERKLLNEALFQPFKMFRVSIDPPKSQPDVSKYLKMNIECMLRSTDLRSPEMQSLHKERKWKSTGAGLNGVSALTRDLSRRGRLTNKQMDNIHSLMLAVSISREWHRRLISASFSNSRTRPLLTALEDAAGGWRVAGNIVYKAMQRRDFGLMPRVGGRLEKVEQLERKIWTEIGDLVKA